MEAYIEPPCSAGGTLSKIVANILFAVIFGLPCVFAGIAGAILFLDHIKASEADLTYYWTLVISWSLFAVGTFSIIDSIISVKVNRRLYKLRKLHNNKKWLWDSNWNAGCTPAKYNFIRTWHKTLCYMFYPGMAVILGYLNILHPEAGGGVAMFTFIFLSISIFHYVWYYLKIKENQVLCCYTEFPIALNSKTYLSVKNLRDMGQLELKLHYKTETRTSRTTYVNGKSKMHASYNQEFVFTKELEGEVVSDTLRILLDLTNVPAEENELHSPVEKCWMLEVITNVNTLPQKYWFHLPIYKTQVHC